MTSNQLAKLAGTIYFLQIFAGSFPLYVRSRLIVADNVDVTVENVLNAEMLFRFSMLSEVAVSLTWLSIAFILYLLFSKVHRESSILFLVLAVIGVAAINANVVHLASMFSLINGQIHAGAFSVDEQKSLSMVLFTLFKKGEVGWSLFAGLWLIPLGYAVLRSRYLPKSFGILLMLASFGYIIPSLISYISPTVASEAKRLIIFSGIVEISFGFWLLLKGVSTNSESGRVIAS